MFFIPKENDNID